MYNDIRTLFYDYIRTLIPIIGDTPLEGNIYSAHLHTEMEPRMISKQNNIISLFKENKFHNMLEIGFNAGFSSALVSLVSPTINITAIDICSHSYVIPCYNKIKQRFSNISLLQGDSKNLLKTLYIQKKHYDIIHIDGDHSYSGCKLDLSNSLLVSKKGTVIIMDDTNLPQCNRVCEEFIKLGKVKEFSLALDKGSNYQHRFLQVI